MTGTDTALHLAPAGRLAFGVSGPHGTALVSRRQTLTLIHAAIAGGITAFDSAPSYGGGEAERRLGLALAGLERKKLFISTKAGLDENKSRDFSPAAMARSLERSLDRLGCDYLDALFLHGPHPLELNDALLGFLQAQRQAGRVRHLGLAGRGAEIDAALQTGLFDLLMTPVHPGLNEAQRQRLARASKAGMGIFAIETLAGASAGLRWPRSMADIWYSARALRYNTLTAPVRRPAEALRAALADPAIDVVMLTTTRAAHLQDALARLDETGGNA